MESQPQPELISCWLEGLKGELGGGGTPELGLTEGPRWLPGETNVLAAVS